jgi:hypothetical protein
MQDVNYILSEKLSQPTFITMNQLYSYTNNVINTVANKVINILFYYFQNFTHQLSKIAPKEISILYSYIFKNKNDQTLVFIIAIAIILFAFFENLIYHNRLTVEKNQLEYKVKKMEDELLTMKTTQKSHDIDIEMIIKNIGNFENENLFINNKFKEIMKELKKMNKEIKQYE